MREHGRQRSCQSCRGAVVEKHIQLILSEYTGLKHSAITRHARKYQWLNCRKTGRCVKKGEYWKEGSSEVLNGCLQGGVNEG